MVGSPPHQNSPPPLPTDAAREALRDVIDPELGISVVDLGLIYDVSIHGRTAQVTMTTTSPVCPLGGLLTKQVEQRLESIDGIDYVEVTIVTDPPWSADRLSDHARQILGYR